MVTRYTPITTPLSRHFSERQTHPLKDIRFPLPDIQTISSASIYNIGIGSPSEGGTVAPKSKAPKSLYKIALTLLEK